MKRWKVFFSKPWFSPAPEPEIVHAEEVIEKGTYSGTTEIYFMVNGKDVTDFGHSIRGYMELPGETS